ncbi:P-loop containing nucleoside triphosphate hydrolase protein [Pterulicium gracile]|uniref:P-loop containing nucleoside triphosphate hydrolase protein n=1 Tax=Pterulicium gracile TaxID=1884261 RepID=A0A5C3QKQ5_9AGAR|nr:P-loop containing nucleoside triphosphate hydrolase protein [Pterula gracilis]
MLTSSRGCAKRSPSTFFRRLSMRQSVFSHPERVQFLAAAHKVESLPPPTGLPEILVTGRANVGKSTLLNAIMGRDSMVRVSKKAGHTKALNFFRLGLEPHQLVLVDSPGYGQRGRREFASVFNEYVTKRNELRRIFVLINAQHGLLDTDKAMMHHICRLASQRETTISIQPVLTKLDTLTMDSVIFRQAMSQIRKDLVVIHMKVHAELEAEGLTTPSIFEPLRTAASMSPPFGVEKLRQSVEDVCELM